MLYSFQPESSNRKTGPIPTTYAHHNHQPARPTSRLTTIAQTLLVAAIVAALTVATILELSK